MNRQPSASLKSLVKSLIRWGLIVTGIAGSVTLAQSRNSLKLPDLIIFNPDSSLVQPGRMLEFTPSPVEIIHIPVLNVQSGVLLPDPKKILVIPETYRPSTSTLLQELAFRLGYREWISVSYKTIIQRQSYYNQFRAGFDHYKPSSDFGRKRTMIEFSDQVAWTISPAMNMTCQADYDYKKEPLLPNPKSGDTQIPYLDSTMLKSGVSRKFHYFHFNPVLNYTLTRSSHAIGMNFRAYRFNDTGNKSDWQNNAFQLFHSSRFQLAGDQTIGIENLLDFQRSKLSGELTQHLSYDYWLYKCVLLYERFPYSFRLEPGFMSKPGNKTFIMDFRAAYQWNLKYGIQQQVEATHQHQTQEYRITREDQNLAISSIGLLKSPEPYGQFQIGLLTTYRQSNRLIFNLTTGYQLVKNYSAYVYDYTPKFGIYELYSVDFERLFLNFTISYQIEGYIKLQNRMKAYTHFNIESESYDPLPEVTDSDWSYSNRLYGLPAFENEFLCTFYLPYQVHLTGDIYYQSSFKVNPISQNIDYLSLNAEFKKTIRKNLDGYITVYNLLNRTQYHYYPILSRDLTIGAGLNWIF